MANLFRPWCALALGLLLLVQGCALPQYAETHIIERDGRQAVRAFRYAGRETNLVDNMDIQLARAPAFRFRFPDGQWVDSRTMTLQTLTDHGLRIEPVGQTRMAVWHPDLPLLASVVGRHQYFHFDIDEKDQVTWLSFGACGEAFKDVLATADGQQTFGFPLAVKDVQTLFGPITRVERVALVTGFSCF